jgi:hypothetical protein
MVVKRSVLLLFLRYSVSYNDEWATARLNNNSVQKHSDTTDLQSYIFTYGIQNQTTPVILKKQHIHYS